MVVVFLGVLFLSIMQYGANVLPEEENTELRLQEKIQQSLFSEE